MVSGGIDNRIRFFHKSSSTPIWYYEAYWDINSVAISSDGSYIAAGTYSPDRKVYLFEKSSNKPLWNYTANARVSSVDISANGKYIVAGSLDNTLRLFYESYEPLAFILTTNADTPDINGSFDLNWTTSRLADNYSIYFYDEYITDINNSLTLLENGIKSLSYSISGLSNGTYYFVIVAFNQFGNITSNCISVEVKLFPPGSFTLSTDAGNLDTDGRFNLLWTDSAYADNYSLYVYNTYITKINNSLTLLENQTGVSPYLISGLSNGTYYFVVVSFNQFGNITSNCISVEVKLFPPGSFTLSTDAGNPDTNGIFNLIWTNSEGADNYSLYVYNSYITEINSSLTLLENQTAISPYSISGLINGTYYYVIVAINRFGNTCSNCIKVLVELSTPPPPSPPDDDGDDESTADERGIAGYDIFLIISLISISIILIIIPIKKTKKKC
ncbi:hypothetical protein ES703_39379 [subsurface metagenome]